LTGSGIAYGSLSDEEVLNFQTTLMSLILHMENAFYNLAVGSKEPSVIIMDRGLMDPKGNLFVLSFRIIYSFF